MSTLNQLLNIYPRKKKFFRNKTPALHGNPQVSAICFKLIIRAPKKPNSAQRKVAKVSLKRFKTQVESYIPGEGHNLATNSLVLIHGGRVQDLPGVKYKCIRGALDLAGVKDRRQGRSRYGVKKPKKKES